MAGEAAADLTASASLAEPAALAHRTAPACPCQAGTMMRRPPVPRQPHQRPSARGQAPPTAVSSCRLLRVREGQRLPVFEAVESDWFRRGHKRFGSSGTTAEANGDWASPADDGWRAAETAASPSSSGVTEAGLPKRVPQANLVPGAVPPSTPTRRAAQVACYDPRAACQLPAGRRRRPGRRGPRGRSRREQDGSS